MHKCWSLPVKGDLIKMRGVRITAVTIVAKGYVKVGPRRLIYNKTVKGGGAGDDEALSPPK